MIEKIVEKCKTHLGEDLHSIYIRGSISRGLGIDSVSDLDTFAITNKEINDIDLKWIDKVEQELNKKYIIVNGVELSFYYIKDVLETNKFSIIPFMIKTHSICVFGEDLSGHLPNYKADTTLGNEHLMNLKNQVHQAKEDLDGNENIEDILDCCGWVMKIIVRAGLARSKVWDTMHGFEIRTNIPDVDVIYFDEKNIDERTEKNLEAELRVILPDILWSVKNEARMHVLNDIPPYISSEDAISKFPETATALGVKVDKNNKLILTAPCGIEDVLNLELKPTPYFRETKERAVIYEERINKKNWKAVWHKIQVHHIEIY